MTDKSQKISIDFSLDLNTVQGANLSNLFSEMDKQYIRQFNNRKDIMRSYRDIPISLHRLYKDNLYVNRRHGKDLQILIDSTIRSKKRCRQVTLVRDSFSTDEEQVFLSFHSSLKALLHEFPERTDEEIEQLSDKNQKDQQNKSRTIYDLIDIFMKVSGDMQSLKDYLNGNQIMRWSQQDDQALCQPETSQDFRNLFNKVGRDEIEKRRWFLLRQASSNVSQGLLPSASASILDKLEAESVNSKAIHMANGKQLDSSSIITSRAESRVGSTRKQNFEADTQPHGSLSERKKEDVDMKLDQGKNSILNQDKNNDV